MANNDDHLKDVENGRIELEENVAKLRASLRHWQAWEIEYESMKEEILELGDEPTSTEIDKTAESSDVGLSDLEKALLTRNEKFTILKNDKGVVRKTDQILNLLLRRIDYVQQNIKTATSLLAAAEKKLIALEVLKEAKAPNEEGLPLTEIHEELDEAGNIMSSSTSVPSQTALTAVEAIQKAAGDVGVKAHGVKPAAISSSTGTAKAISKGQAPAISKTAPKLSNIKPEPGKKHVSFANHSEDLPNPDIATDHKASEQHLLKEISDREDEELERKEMAESVIPEGESPGDAALRRQMIQYNMDEVGAVVAEIDLEDDTTSQSEYDSETGQEDVDEDEVDDSKDEEEDEFGRTSKLKPLDEDYVKRMQALSDKLKADAMINVGPSHLSDTKRQRISPAREANKTESKDAPTKKKGVRFAEDLDVQEAPEVSVTNLLAASSAMTGRSIAQLPVVERMTSAEAPVEETDAGVKKISKFKAAHARASANVSIASAFNSAPNAPKAPKPPSQILADSLVERPFAGSNTSSPAPDESDGLDPSLFKNQVSTAYHRLRSRQIQREGGFFRNDHDQAEVPLTEEEGGQKKMSRFKAARLGLQ